MSDASKEIIFLIRAYNDLDIQLSLINQFADDQDYRVRVIGYPCDGDVGNPRDHEAAPYMMSKGVEFTTVLDDTAAPFYLRVLYKLGGGFARFKKSKIGNIPLLNILTKAVHVSLLKLLRRSLNKPCPWLHEVTKHWKPDLIMMDEALAQPNRSYFIADVLPKLISDGAVMHTVLTGQNIYFNPNPSGSELPVCRKMQTKEFFVPSALDKKICGVVFPQETFNVRGNLRMETPWVKKLHSEVLVEPFLDKAKYLKTLPDGKLKIVFMLSKMNYGVEDEALKKTIRALAAHPDIALSLKPHTRGMKFDFMSKNEIRDAAIVNDVPSALLIEWADMVLFTGSGIAFHAMNLEKNVGFLKYCQRHDTVFDDGKSVMRIDTLEALMHFIDAGIQGGLPETNYRQWLTDNVHNGDDKGEVALHYKSIMLGSDSKREAA